MSKVYFDFNNEQEFNLLDAVIEDISVNIFKKLRIISASNPMPNGGTHGFETMCKVRDRGKLAKNYKYELIYDDNVIRRGTTNNNGEISELSLKGLSAGFRKYTLVIEKQDGDGI